MNRLRDYLLFAVRFIGLGYVVLWPVSTPGNGDLFGAVFLCGGRAAVAFDLVCRMPHPLQLGLGLHLFGALCALLAAAHLILGAVRRRRAPRGEASAVAAEVPASPAPAVVTAKPRPRRRMPPPRKLARPRAHFGLRGVPQ